MRTALPAVRAGTTDRPLPDDRTRQGRGTCHRRTDRLPRLRRLLVSFPGWPGTRARLRDVAESRAAGGASWAHPGRTADQLGGGAPPHRPCLGRTRRSLKTLILVMKPVCLWRLNFGEFPFHAL